MRVGLNDIKMARQAIAPYINRTPLAFSKYFSDVTGSNVWLKFECVQKTGSFKIRGAMNKVSSLPRDEGMRGVITCSAGNHGQAVAYSCKVKGYPCTVVMPSGSPHNKVAATEGYGAKVVLHNDELTLFERTEEIRKERNLTFVHSFNDPYVIAGQGTVALEIMEERPEIEAVVASVGGGGLISGAATAVKAIKPSAKVIGVEPVGAQTMTMALKQGRPVKLDSIETLADGLTPAITGDMNLEIVRTNVDEIALVTDEEIVGAIKMILERTKYLVEPAGAASLAALITGKVRLPGKNVAVILSGGNLDLNRLKAWI